MSGVSCCLKMLSVLRVWDDSISRCFKTKLIVWSIKCTNCMSRGLPLLYPCGNRGGDWGVRTHGQARAGPGQVYLLVGGVAPVNASVAAGLQASETSWRGALLAFCGVLWGQWPGSSKGASGCLEVTGGGECRAWDWSRGF